jgi:flagellum-specific peptidoglycan hydrolase FlgJ
MKNSPCYFNFSSAFLTAFLFATEKLTSQSDDSSTFKVNYPYENNVQTLSANIAAQYSADAATVESYVQAAINSEDKIGIPAAVIIGIAVYESSFTSHLFLNSRNPFGIKAGKDWTGPTYTIHDDGADTPFRVYGSAEEAIADFGAFIRARGWYADALACPSDDYKCVVDGLKKTDAEPGYSTNSDWDEKVIEMIEKLGLQDLSR